MNSTTSNYRQAARGFTLLELIISVALVLVLMLAVTKIFSITSATIGATQGIAAATRDARAAQAVFARDMAALAGDSPFIWIRYDGYQPAFRNAADKASDSDFPDSINADGSSTAASNAAKYTIDLDDNGIEGENLIPGEDVGTLAISNRVHRLDQFSFCARDLFARQTGNSLVVGNAAFPTDQLVSSMTSNEAWITYVHMALPKPDGSYNTQSGGVKTYPGAGSSTNNPSNYYASQWILGRTALLMVMPTVPSSGLPSGETLNDASGAPQQYYGRTSSRSWTNAADNNFMSPLSTDTTSHPVSGRASKDINEARYDLVGIDIANARDRIERKKTVGTGNWWTDLSIPRPEVNPYIIKPINADTSSHQVPIFLPACSQFVVEYAGDFVSQLPDGTLDVTAANGGLTPDGIVDFHFVAATGQKKIQWFGYPRSTTGGNVANATTGDDVLLIGDFVGYITGTGALTTNPSVTHYTNYSQLAAQNSSFAAWERFGTATTPAGSATARGSITFTDTRGTVGINTIYAAWGPDSIDNLNQPRPKMFRITIAIDRPEMAGRSADPQTFEYIFNVP